MRERPPTTDQDGRRATRLLVAAYAGSSFGTYLDMVSLGLYALHVTGSPLQTGLFMALRLGSGVVAAPLAGLLAARLPRKTLMITADLTAAAAVAAVAWSGSAQLLYALAAVLGATQAV